MTEAPVVVVIASDDALVVAAVAAAAARARRANRHVSKPSELASVVGRLPAAVVVLDLRLGSTTGGPAPRLLDLVPALLRRAGVAGHRLQVVVVGVGPDPDEVRDARRSGAFHCMAHPPAPGALSQVLAAALDRLSRIERTGEPPSTGPLVPLDPSPAPTAVPSEAGVLVLHDGFRQPIWIEWAADLAGRVRALSVSPELAEARFVAVHPTTDPSDAAKIFDRLVNVTGRFPRLMRTAPPGARHRSDAELRGPATESGCVTLYGRSADSRLAGKLRSLFLARPRERETLEWLAFALYSNDMFEEAVACYDDLLQGWPVRQEYLFYCANAEYKRGRTATARDLWRRAAVMDETSVIGTKSRTRANRNLEAEPPARHAPTASEAEHHVSNDGTA